jgi:RsmE family RNA methyltransferase
VNLLLLEGHEVAADGIATLRDRRAEHLRTVLKVTPGQQLRAGLLDGPLGSAEVCSVSADAVTVRAHFHTEAPPAPDALLLAVPRPKVLLRLLAQATALGIGRMVLFRSWRVDKSHLSSEALRPELQRRALLAGLEQAGRTALPAVSFFPLFKPFVEDVLPDLPLPPLRFVAHPAAAVTTAELALPAAAPLTLALGPEGGFLPYEVEQLHARGFLPLSLGPHALRTESALSVLHGQLDLLRRRGHPAS